MEIKKSAFRENVEAFAIAVLTILFIIIFIFQSFLVKGTSMEPTLHDGERLIVNKFIFRIREPMTGDIIVLKPPKEPTKKYIKRVIGLPGDYVSIQHSKVYVNFKPLEEPYLKDKTFDDYPEVQVPPGKIFVMGDNRNGSLDSRSTEVGFVPLVNVVGKAAVIFWPLFDAKIIINPKYPGLDQTVNSMFSLPFNFGANQN